MRALVLLVVGGCSWATVTPPPQVPGPPPVDCTQTVTAPVVDTMVAVLTVSVAIATTVYTGVTAANHEENLFGTTYYGGVVFASIGGMFALSAHHGYSTTGRCRSLNRGD